MNNLPKITVATVTFNSASIIEDCIQSVLRQKYNNLEYIIIDGNSTDGTVDILKKYYSQIRYVSEPDKGIYDAMNKALRMSTGDYLIFIGSDDRFVSLDVLARMSTHLKNETIIYYGNVLRPLKMEIYCGKYNKYKLAVKNISHQAIFYPRSVYKSLQYDLHYKLFADYVYNMQLWKNIKFQYVPILVTCYNETGLSATSVDDAFIMDYTRLRLKHLGFFPLCYSKVYHFLRILFKLFF